MIKHHKVYPEVDEAELDEWITKARRRQQYKIETGASKGLTVLHLN